MAQEYPIRRDISQPGKVAAAPPVPATYKVGQAIGATTPYLSPLTAPTNIGSTVGDAVGSAARPYAASLVEGMFGLKPGILTAKDAPTMRAAAAKPKPAPAPKPADRAELAPSLKGIPLGALERIVAMSPKPASARDQVLGQASSVSQSIFQNQLNSIEAQLKAGSLSKEDAQEGVGSAIQAMYERQARLVGFQNLPQFPVAQPDD